MVVPPLAPILGVGAVVLTLLIGSRAVCTAGGGRATLTSLALVVAGLGVTSIVGFEVFLLYGLAWAEDPAIGLALTVLPVLVAICSLLPARGQCDGDEDDADDDGGPPVDPETPVPPPPRSTRRTRSTGTASITTASAGSGSSRRYERRDLDLRALCASRRSVATCQA